MEQMEQVIESIMQRKKEQREAALHPPAKPRFAGIDIVKIVACFFVTAVHFFRNCGFYSMSFTSGFTTVTIYIRWLVFTCVPLFMITTGFLMKNKKLSGRYYLGIVRVLVIYVVISLICVRFNQSYFHLTFTAWDIVRDIFMYKAAPYGWYVEYYITIFLLIPFLNAGYQAMETRGRKTALVLTVIMLTMVSQSFYIGTEKDHQIRVLPGFFALCYPIAYYFIGAYIREFPPKRDLKHKMVYVITGLFALIYVSTVTLYQCLKNTEKNNAWTSWHNDDYCSWPVALMSTSIFLLLFDITIRDQRWTKILAMLSKATFAAYLISYVFDGLFYSKLVLKVPDIYPRYKFALLIVPAVFILSMLSGLAIQGLYDLAANRIKKIRLPAAKRA